MEDDTPVVEDRLITDTDNMRLESSDQEESGDSEDSDTSGEAEEEVSRGISVPVRRSEEAGDMSQSYHEIFDTQPYQEKREAAEGVATVQCKPVQS